MSIEKLKNANFVEKIEIENLQTGLTDEFIIFVKSGENVNIQDISYSMSEWKIRLMNNHGIGIEVFDKFYFENCHSYDEGEYREGKPFGVYGTIFLFNAKTLEYNYIDGVNTIKEVL